MAKTLTHVSTTAGDWEGIYIDGIRIGQGHHVQLRDICEALDIDYDQFEIDSEKLEELSYGEMPEKLEDCQELEGCQECI